MKHVEMEACKHKMENIKPSHQEATKIREGAQMDMFEKQITNYSGFGPIIKIIGNTAQEAENLAIVVCELINGAITVHDDKAFWNEQADKCGKRQPFPSK